MVRRVVTENQVSIRKMHLEDIPLGMKLKSYAGWNQVATDWELFLSAGGENFVASLGGTDVGTVISIPYQDHFSWVGMVLVDPSARRRGVGRALLLRSVKASSAMAPVRLDATSEGYALYRTLGFRREYELLRMVRNPGTIGLSGDSVCIPLEEDDMPGVIDYDKPVFGADRSIILNSLYTRKPDYAYCINKSHRIEGYGLGRSGSKYEQIGPVIADTIEGAEDLLSEILKKCELKEVVTDVFVDKPEWISFLENMGFRKERSFIRMCLGPLKHQGITRNQYSIAGPETG